MATKQIVILGGGFGGVYTAMQLEKMLRPGEASISLVNTENYFVYQPMLPEVISGSIAITDVVCPIRRLCPRTQLIMREVQHIDLQKQTVTVSRGFRPRQMELPYDYLVVALGGETNFYGMPGMVEHAMPFRTLSHALALRNHLIHALEEADIENDAELRRKLLTFVVAGGPVQRVGIDCSARQASADSVAASTRDHSASPLNKPVLCSAEGTTIHPPLYEPLTHTCARSVLCRSSCYFTLLRNSGTRFSSSCHPTNSGTTRRRECGWRLPPPRCG